MALSMGGFASSNNTASGTYNNNAAAKRAGTSREWTKHEDDLLRQLVEEKGTKNWAGIAQQLPGRKESTCQRRWNKVIKPSLVKGPWTEDEDEKLLVLIAKHGAKRWNVAATELPGRTGKSCRDRWLNHLNTSSQEPPQQPPSDANNNNSNSSSSSSKWTVAEDVMILNHQAQMGNKWVEMTKFLPGRYVPLFKGRQPWLCVCVVQLVVNSHELFVL
jgi:hypothetical protein